MSDYKTIIRLAREVESVRVELEADQSPEHLERLQQRIRDLHAEVGTAFAAHVAKQPWFTRWAWALRLRHFEA